MPNTGNRKAQGNRKMSKTAAVKRGEETPLGEAALKEALAGFGAAANTTGGSTAGNGAQVAGDAPSPAGHSAAPTAPASKTVSQVLGEITWLMTQSPRHKALSLGDLEWLVMPAILLKQFRIFYKGEQPVGVALWALVDDLVAKRIDGGDKRLTAAEWKSGATMRIVDVVAPFGGEAEMRGQLDGAPTSS
jgi:cytolysin-activating lysine-acyltransferase